MGFFQLGVDLESFYDTKQGYSLRAKDMDIPTYLLDPRFEEIGCSFKENDAPSFFVDGPDIPRYLAGLPDPSTIMWTSHNTLFDACWASWRHNFVAGFYVDTMALARALLRHVLRRMSLESVAAYLKVGIKGKEIHNMNGLNRQAIIDAGLMHSYAGYSNNDNDLAVGIRKILMPQMPAAWLVINDMVQRMAIEPMLKLDRMLLAEHLAQTVSEKTQLLVDAGLTGDLAADKATLMSNDKFAAQLEGMGVDPPLKLSLATGQMTYAFAKSDEAFKELLDHPDPAVQAVVAARLGVKSTLEETRTIRNLRLASLHFPYLGTDVKPIALKCSGAHTHRLSGDWKFNDQNMPRASRKHPRAMLRESIVAPEGYVVVASDSSQIEARMNGTFNGQWDLVEQFRNKLDPYSIMASKMFGYAVTKLLIAERFCGKTTVLSAGYQVGWRRYQAAIKHLSFEQTGNRIVLTDDTAMEHIALYREANDKIVEGWRYAQYTVIPAMTRPDCDFWWGPLHVTFEKITLPGGLALHYNMLHKDAETGNWRFQYGEVWKYLYGGKLMENIIQAMACVNTMFTALRMKKPARELGARLAMQCHDELAYCCPRSNAPELARILDVEMVRPIQWMPMLPLACETGYNERYGLAH